MANTANTDYLYASARVKSVEKNMLTKERIEKMIDAKTPSDALKVLYDCEYGDTGEPVDPENFEEILASEHKKAYDFVSSVAPEGDSFKIFKYPYDYHNLKTLMKAEFLGIDADDILTDTGNIEVAKLKVILRERMLSELTEDMRKAMNDVIESFSKTRDPQVIDIIFDKACYSDMLKAASQTGVSFIEEYLKLLIDTVNLKTYARLRRMGKSWDFFSKVFISGGNIDERTFITNYDDQLEQFADKLLAYGFMQVLSDGADALKETGKFTALEKLCDNKLIEFVKSSKYVPFGIEPIVGYLIAKEQEIKTARIVMAGKLAGLKPESIRERLRETYV